MEIKLSLTEELRPFKNSHFRQLLHDRVWSLCNHLLPQFSMDRFQTWHTTGKQCSCAFGVLMKMKAILTEL